MCVQAGKPADGRFNANAMIPYSTPHHSLKLVSSTVCPPQPCSLTVERWVLMIDGGRRDLEGCSWREGEALSVGEYVLGRDLMTF